MTDLRDLTEVLTTLQAERTATMIQLAHSRKLVDDLDEQLAELQEETALVQVACNDELKRNSRLVTAVSKLNQQAIVWLPRTR